MGTEPASGASEQTNLRDLAISSLRNDARFRKLLQLTGPVLATGVAGLIQAWIKIKPNEFDWLFNTISFGLAVYAIGVAGLLAYFDKNGPEALKVAYEQQGIAEELDAELKERSADLAKAQDALLYLARLYAVLIPLREVVEAVISEGPGGREAQDARLGDLLDLLIASKGDLFRIKDERWNFAVYLWNEHTMMLECAACRRRDRADESAPHRSWPSGVGHVGRAFHDGREYVADDTQKIEMRQFFRAPGELDRADDPQRYRSFAAVPIRMNGQKPTGVVIATSDEPGRFWPQEALPTDAIDAVEPIRAFASILALIASATTLHGKIGIGG